MHGLINFLLTSHPAVLQLREIFDFWIMPIANPDGVVLGNYRCNMQGKDLNRCFQFSNDEEYGGTYSSVKECECIQTFMNENIFINSKNSKNSKVTQSLS
jgi:murein tripeptide amidase MpaA